MQDLDNQAQKLITIFLNSVAAVSIADEAAANAVLKGYQSPQQASNLLFDLLIVLENTGQAVGTVRALANHLWIMWTQTIKMRLFSM